ncbi:MAK10-like protein [Tanacetum coccineum]
MGDANPIRTLGDYSKPNHEGYRNTIELPVGNNVDPNQHLKDFLNLVDSLDLDGKNRKRTRMRLFQFSLRDQASNWLERLPAESVTTWEDLTTRFLAQFFPLERPAKLRNDILMFQQHQGESLSEAWTRFKDLLQKFPHHGIDLWLQVQIFYDHVTPVTRRTIDQSTGGKLRDRNVKESWALLEDLALYDNESWNDPRDFAKPVKAISLPQDVPSTSDPASSSSRINGPYDTQYCMKDPEQAFVEYASSRTDEAGGDDGDVMFIEIAQKHDNSRDKEPEAGEQVDEYIDTFPTKSELIPCNIGYVHVEKAYIDLNSPLNVMTQMMYNWIMRRKLNPRGVSNFTGRIKGMHVFIGNFTYVLEFMIVGDISSIIDPRLSQVVLGKPFVDISNMTHDPTEGVVRFTNGTDEIAYKMPHKIKQYNSLSNLEKEHTKSVYLRNEEDRRRGV